MRRQDPDVQEEAKGNPSPASLLNQTRSHDLERQQRSLLPTENNPVDQRSPALLSSLPCYASDETGFPGEKRVALTRFSMYTPRVESPSDPGAAFHRARERHSSYHIEGVTPTRAPCRPPPNLEGGDSWAWLPESRLFPPRSPWY
jgi:hypothetical protein